MVILITGASHTGKTALAQKLLKKRHFPYLSIDHLKMGLIRSGNTALTPLSPDEELTAYLWPIVREMVKTAIENKQNLIVEGCYIPLDLANDFPAEYLHDITCYCLVMSERYIERNFADIERFSNVIERRLCDEINKEQCLLDNREFFQRAKAHGVRVILIDEKYEIEIE